MNSNIKFYLVTGLLAFVFGIAFIVYIIFYSGQPQVPDKLTYKINGQDIEINNFEKNAKELAATIYLEEVPNYSIVFSKSDNSFTIILKEYTRVNLSSARMEAETQLVEILGTTPEMACKLPVAVIVPVSYNEQYSNKDYGLSWCEFGQEFEEEAPITETETVDENNNLR